MRYWNGVHYAEPPKSIGRHTDFDPPHDRFCAAAQNTGPCDCFGEDFYEDACPEWKALQDGWEEALDDPITQAYGAGGMVSDSMIASIDKHVKACTHPWCVQDRKDRLG